MTASTAVHSNAFSFMSFLTSGVDPRTGQYTVSIRIPEVRANDLQGPGLPLGLFFSPLNSTESGYGKGWNLQLSQVAYHTDPVGGNTFEIVTLHTGETFRLAGEITDPVTGLQRRTMKEQKLASFHLYPLPANQGLQRYKVAHRSGLVEILQQVAADQPALPVEIYSAEGHTLTLAYVRSSRAGNPWRLSTITDAAGTILLRLDDVADTQQTGVAVRYRPTGNTEFARFFIQTDTAGRVDQLRLPATNDRGDLANWAFTYVSEKGLDCIKTARTPAGAKETLTYDPTGHAFPMGSQREPLPRVASHVIDPGHGQPQQSLHYSYPRDEHNFLGNGLNIVWAEDGLDNLYLHLGTYTYGSTEELRDGTKVLRSVERQYNQFHLQVLEKTTRNGHVHSVASEYDHDPMKYFADQVASCQLPRTLTTQWSLGTGTREEKETYEYDALGNLRKQTLKTGVVEDYAWYPARGEAGCPKDEEGFTRHLKSKTVTPAPATNTTAPTLRSKYTYKTLTAVVGSTHNRPWHAPDNETEVDVKGSLETELHKTVYDYHPMAAANATPVVKLRQGRLKSRSVTLNRQASTATTTAFEYEKGDIGGDRKETVLITTQTVTGHDNTRKTLTHEHSLNHGQPLLSEDDNGVQIRYEYDALQRVTKEIVAPNLPAFKAERTYSYTLCATDNDQASQTLVNARGISTVTQLDGLARGILETRDHIDERSPKQPYTLQTLDYTAEGQIAKREQCDYLPHASTGAPEPYSLISTFAFDDWGQLSCTTRPDQVEEHSVFDPIGDSLHRGVKLKTWRQAQGTGASKSRQRETWLDVFERTVRVHRLDATGIIEGQQRRVQDGLGNCTQYTNERQGNTTYAYDAWMRLSNTTLPNNNEIIRCFAPHSRDELVAEVKMIDTPGAPPWSLGTQDYDHLGRLTKVNVAGRVQTHVYKEGQRFPSETHTAAGKALTYDYDLALSDAPKGVTSEDPLDSATFEFNPSSARLTKAVNRHGTREYDYAPDNQLIRATWRDANGSVVETSQKHSPMGRLITRTHTSTPAAGTPKQTLSSQFSYNSRGQLVKIEQGNLTSNFTYDTHGRLRTLTSFDGSAKQATVMIDYDDHDRETMRTLESTGQSMLTLSQDWGLDGLLMQRLLKKGTSTALQEDFTYDVNGRLHTIRYSGNQLPRDEQKRAITKQTFAFDELDNMKSCECEFSAAAKETATFHYNPADRCQLLNISYEPKRQLQAADIQYDGNGCQATDLTGRLYRYDTLGRLLSITDPTNTTTTYRYDANGHLVARAHDHDDETLFSHEGNRLSLAVKGAVMTALVYHGTQPIAQQSTNSSLPVLLHTNASHSVIAEYRGGQQHEIVYDAYGEHDRDELRMSLLGYNGEYLDPERACYPLGRGLRFYFPGDRRFRQADPVGLANAAEFGRYGYCKGNPVMLLDPSGRTATPVYGSLEQGRMAYQSLEMTPYEEEVWQMEIEQRRLEREQKKKISGSMWAAIGIGALFTVLAVVSAGAAIVGAVGAAAAAAAGTGAAAAATQAMIVAGVSVVVAAASAVSFAADVTAIVTQEPWAMKFSEIAGYVNAGVSLLDGMAVKYLTARALQQSMQQSLRRGVLALVDSSAKVGKTVALNYSMQDPEVTRL